VFRFVSSVLSIVVLICLSERGVCCAIFMVSVRVCSVKEACGIIWLIIFICIVLLVLICLFRNMSFFVYLVFMRWVRCCVLFVFGILLILDLGKLNFVVSDVIRRL